MTILRVPPVLLRKRLLPITILVSVALLAGYVALLNHEERAMEAYYSNLRQADTDLYLSKTMQARGFRVFLKEYLAIYNYTQPKAEVPPFLVGRWALFDEEKRVSDNFIPDLCLSGVELGDGRMKFFGADTVSYPARFSMAGTTVTAHLADAGRATIDVVGYGSHLNHIVVKGPDSSQPRYGYMCR